MTGIQLKKEVRKLGLTQEEAANAIGISRQTLSVWMKSAIVEECNAALVATKLNISNPATTDNSTPYHAESNASTVSIPTEVWEVIKNQAASLKSKDEQTSEALKQTSEMIAILKEQVKKSAEGAETAARAIAAHG